MTETVRRWRTLRAYERALVERGKEHPRTIAAYARACEAWGPDRVRPVLVPANTRDSQAVTRFERVLAKARLRARGARGLDNRGARFAKMRNAYA